MNRGTLAGLAMGAALAATASAGAVDVYQNSSTRIGTVNALVPAGAAASGVERGNTVTLAGDEREVTGIHCYMHILGTGVASFDMHIRFYANDGVGGAPGTQLWDSGDQRVTIDSGGDLPYFFLAPGIRVPDSFTWTVEVNDRTGFNTSVLGPAHYNPPAIGSAPFGYWERQAGQGAWTFAGQNEPPFGARIAAVRCYVNCDASTTPPVLNVNDFICFQSRFATGDLAANCDGSTSPPVLNVNDFICYQSRFAAGCP